MQEPQNFKAFVSDIRSALERLDGETRSGAEIHEIIMATAPHLNIRSVVGMPTGPGALTQFIETYLNQTLKRIGKKGGDVLYRIGDDVHLSSPNVISSSQIDAKIWQTFVSPHAVSSLFLNMSDMLLFVADTFELNENVHHIKAVTGDEHDAMRQEFRLSLTDGQRAMIDEETENNLSYGAFVSALRSNGLMSVWGKFRREAFKRLLAQRLEQIPLNIKLVPNVVSQLIGSQQTMFRADKKTSVRATISSNAQPTENPTLYGSDNLDSVRTIARSVIDHMGYDEIRAIHLPLGAVLDAFSDFK